ncbi:MAG: sugar transferase [Candidatus Omnitrophota bacterium]
MTRKKKQLETRKRILAGLFVMVFGLCVASAWATVSFVKPQDASQYIATADRSEIPADVTETAKTRAPEPSTMALFGGGIVGMVMSFIRRTYAAVKRVFDVVACVAGAIILSPLLILAAVLVRVTSKGPIIYSQTRVGKDGQHFQIYKFRTMRVDAEKNTGPVWAAKDDKRLTPVGKFLRKSHIDELPQLFNVFRGEMSVIGPRPERPVFVTEFKQIIPNYENRLAVKPGITGLAQVWHRYDETIQDVKKKLRYDLLYIRRMCFWADLNIILRTVRVVITGEGAR